MGGAITPLTTIKPGFGPWLKRVRQSKKLKQDDVCERAGLGRTTITAWENSRVNFPTVDAMARLAVGYDLDLGYLMHKAGFDIGASGLDLVRLRRIEKVFEVLDAGAPVIRRALAESYQAVPMTEETQQHLHRIGEALASLDLVTERLREEDIS